MPNSLIPDPGRQVAVEPELAAVLEERVFKPARTVGADLPVIAVTDPPPPIEIRRSPRGTWWVAANADADPVALTNDGVVVAPPDVIARLTGLRAAGVDFDYIWIGHEWPGDWEPGTPPPPMKIAGPAPSAPLVSAQQTTFEVGRQLLAAARSLAEKTAVAAAAAASATASAASSAGQSVGAAVESYDPVVLGGIKDPNSDRIAWLVLDAWDEEPR